MSMESLRGTTCTLCFEPINTSLVIMEHRDEIMVVHASCHHAYATLGGHYRLRGTEQDLRDLGCRTLGRITFTATD